MTACHWAICERTNRWATALRVALKREATAERPAARIYEARNLHDLDSHLAARPEAFVTIEAERSNFASVLSWLASAEPTFPHARFVALLDRSLCRGGTGHDALHDVERALLEAGAIETVHWSGQWPEVIQLALRHAASCNARRVATRDDLTPAERIWASLPWQGE